jgi:hypothetical protein
MGSSFVYLKFLVALWVVKANKDFGTGLLYLVEHESTG